MDGHLYAWYAISHIFFLWSCFAHFFFLKRGYNERGQCGSGSCSLVLATPTLVKQSIDRPCTLIASGHNHTLAVLGGLLFSFGCGDRGQLGNALSRNPHGTHTDVLTWDENVCVATPIESLRRKDIIAIGAGGRHSFCVCLEMFEQEGEQDSLVFPADTEWLNANPQQEDPQTFFTPQKPTASIKEELSPKRTSPPISMLLSSARDDLGVLEITKDRLTRCVNEVGEPICLGEGGFGQVFLYNYRPVGASPRGLFFFCLPFLFFGLNLFFLCCGSLANVGALGSSVVAVKEIVFDTDLVCGGIDARVLRTIRNEVRLVKLLSHTNVIEVFGFVQLSDRRLGIVMHYMEGGSLLHFCQTHKLGLTNCEKWFVFTLFLADFLFIIMFLGF